jgi:hypothetical protein
MSQENKTIIYYYDNYQIICNKDKTFLYFTDDTEPFIFSNRRETKGQNYFTIINNDFYAGVTIKQDDVGMTQDGIFTCYMSIPSILFDKTTSIKKLIYDIDIDKIITENRQRYIKYCNNSI